MSKRLTQAAVERLKHYLAKGKNPTEIPDAGKPGLILVIQPTGLEPGRPVQIGLKASRESSPLTVSRR